jgi:hypothetical protein
MAKTLENAEFLTKINSYESLEKNFNLITENLEQKKNQINQSLKPLIFKYENQLRITELEIKSLENDIKLGDQRYFAQSSDLKKINSLWADTKGELRLERGKLLQIMGEKNELGAREAALVGQVKDLVGLVKGMEREKDQWKFERENFLGKYGLLQDRNFELERGLSKAANETQVLRDRNFVLKKDFELNMVNIENLHKANHMGGGCEGMEALQE